MKVLVITENLGSGGAERQLSGLAVFLKRKGYDVKVITYLKRQFYEDFLKENSVDYELHEELLPKLKRIWRMIKLLKRIKPDVVISFLPSVNKTMCIVRFFIRFYLIVSERSHTQVFDFRTKLGFLLYKKADRIVANSKSEVNNIVSHIPSLRKKLIAIPNFVDVNLFIPNELENRSKKLNILCVGRVIPSKNLLRFIDAVAIVVSKGYEFNVCWAGHQYDKLYLENVRKRILQYNLQETITLLGQCENIVKEYQKADVFCLPSLFEGYPNVLVEAMSCRLPVICSNVCENPLIVEDGINGFLFNPNDTISIANSIEKLLKMSHKERIDMGFRNREKIINNNSIDSFVNQYIKLIDYGN